MALAVAVDLPTQRTKIAAVAMPDIRRRLVHQREAGLQDLIEQVGILADSGWHAWAKRLIHQANLRVSENVGAERGVGCRAEIPGLYRASRSLEPVAIDLEPFKAAAKAAVVLENVLRRRFKLDRDRIARDNHHVGADK